MFFFLYLTPAVPPKNYKGAVFSAVADNLS